MPSRAVTSVIGIVKTNFKFNLWIRPNFNRCLNTTAIRFLNSEYCNGPDQILPATSFKTSEPNGTVELYRTPTGAAASEPTSVYSMFKRVHDTFPTNTALIVDRDGQELTWTYNRYFDETKQAAKAMIKLGLERFHGVCIMGFNAPEWFMANYGTIFSGGLSAGVYTTNSVPTCIEIAKNCRAQIAIIDDENNVAKFLEVQKTVPHVKVIVQWLGKPKVPGVLSWDEFLDIGRKETEEKLIERLSLSAINQCCSLIYTSGTTGPPKGVMASQDHLTWAAEQYSDNFKLKVGDSVGVSYLPLSHIAANIGEMNCTLYNGLTVHFAQPDALRGSLGKTVMKVRPHGFIGVPRVWEKYYEALQEIAAKNNRVGKAIAGWAKTHVFDYNMAFLDGRVEELSWQKRAKYFFAKKLIINQIKKALGLNRVYFLATGTAPIDPNILNYFLSLDLPIQEGYGLSESLCFGSMNVALPNQYRLGSVGKVVPQTEMKLQPNSMTSKDEAEILMKGRNIMMGYLREPEKTKEVLDDNGWFYSGDIGRMDNDGYLYITGRIKELIITAGGENVPPNFIEESIKKELPCISNAFVIGDRRKFLTILLTLKAEIDSTNSNPLQGLTSYCRQWMKKQGLGIKTVKDAVTEIENNPQGKLFNAIDQGIKRYNDLHAISNAQKVQRWTVLPHDFSEPTGELNTTMKVKRKAVIEKYEKVIETMYK